MPLKLPEPASCPHCWSQKHKCIRDPTTLHCRNCLKYIDEHLIPSAPEFYDATAHREIFRLISKDTLSTLSTVIDGSNINHLGVQVTSSAGLTSPTYNFHIDGLFDSRNKIIIWELDRMVQAHLTADLRGKDRFSGVIRDSVLAGGYIHFLCSTIPIGEASEQVHTTRDGVSCINDYPEYGLQQHLQYLVLCRLRELIHASLDGIRVGDLDMNSPLEASNAYAAATILKSEVTYFRRSLRNGDLCLAGNLPPGLKDILVDWFTSIEKELSNRLGRACGLYPNWQDSILGSKKSSRRGGETLTLFLTLHQIIQISCEPLSGSTQFTPSGDGNNCLLSPTSSPGLTALKLPCSTPVEIEQLPSHVSYPLPELFGTRAETSDLVPCDLLSHWRQPSIRSSDEDSFLT